MYQRKSTLVIVSIVSILVILNFGVMYFGYKNIKEKVGNYHFILGEINFQSSKKDYLVSKLKTINDISAEIEKIDSTIVPKDGEVKFIESIESLAKENGLTIELGSLVLENNPKQASSTITVLKVKAITKGTWFGNYRFLARLESLPTKIRIKNYNIESISKGYIVDAKKKNVPVNIWQSAFELEVLKYK